MSIEAPGVFIDPRAIVESDIIGAETAINAYSWVREGARIGQRCNIVSYAIVGLGVILEDEVTVMNHASIGSGALIRRGSFIGPNVVITDDIYPRSPQASEFRAAYNRSGWSSILTEIGPCASIGAGSIVLPGCRIGEYAMVAAGSIVTRSVPARALVKGNPARFAYWVDDTGRRAKSLE